MDTAADWEAAQASGTDISLPQCDTSEAAHVKRLVALAQPLDGVWHAAGVLADAATHANADTSTERFTNARAITSADA